MFSTVIFGVGLAGLALLFSCKALELSRNARTPLLHLRRAGDPLVAEGRARALHWCRREKARGIAACVRTGKHVAREGASLFDALAHGAATRLNKYLRGRRTDIRRNGQNGNVSHNLKTVFAKTDDATTTEREN